MTEAGETGVSSGEAYPLSELLRQPIVWVAIGGAAGAMGRYVIGKWALGLWGAEFPYGTLIVNVVGSFVLGFLVTASAERLQLPAILVAFAGVGFCGSFTTFSTYSINTMELAQAGMIGSAVINVLLNNVLCLSAAVLGALVARMLPIK